MKRRLRVLIVFAGTIAMVMALNVGAASAHHGANSPAFADADAAIVVDFESAVLAADEAPSPYPVGQNALGLDPQPDPHPGQFKGFLGNPNANALTAIANNPNCPLHYLP